MNKIDPKLKKDFSFAEKLFLEKKYEEAIKSYNNILADYPNLIEAINNIGQSYEYLNQLYLALKYYQKCSVMAPDEKIFKNNIGNIFYKKKDYNKAIKELENSLLIDNNQIKIIEKKAKCLIALNLRSEANLFIEKFLKKFPNNYLLNILYAKNLISINYHKKGLEKLKKITGFIELNESKISIIN